MKPGLIQCEPLLPRSRSFSPVDDWGAGVTNLRVGWNGAIGELQAAPFLGLNNLWDRRYVGSVTLNAVGGRVLEPAPRRVIDVGTEIGFRSSP